jgi:hypothetical protein
VPRIAARSDTSITHVGCDAVSWRYGALGEGSCGPAGIEVSGSLFELSQSNF